MGTLRDVMRPETLLVGDVKVVVVPAPTPAEENGSVVDLRGTSQDTTNQDATNQDTTHGVDGDEHHGVDGDEHRVSRALDQAHPGQTIVLTSPEPDRDLRELARYGAVVVDDQGVVRRAGVKER
jgi:hypothetical protein